MKYKINKNNNQVSVKVTIPVRSKLDCPERIIVKTDDVLEILRKEKIKVGKLISDSITLRNTTGRTKYKSAEWIFEAYQPPKQTTYQRNKKKTKKTLDKIADHVIIEEYKSSLPPKEENKQ